MKSNAIMRSIVLLIVLTAVVGAAVHSSDANAPSLVGHEALEYLRGLQGRWVVDGGDEGTFGWEFDVTSRESVVVERLKVGTKTEMTTVYYLSGEDLIAAHYCQLHNQPILTATDTAIGEDLHFVCNGEIGGTKSHDELHMHRVHFQRNGDSIRIWMDMVEGGELAFETSYELTRVPVE